MNNQIRDAVVGKCSSAYVRRKLLEEGPNLTLKRAMEIAALCERIEENIKQTVNQVEGQTDYAFAIQDDCRDTDRLNVCLGNVHLRMLVDSGASSNVIDEKTWEKLKPERIKCHSFILDTENKMYLTNLISLCQ